MQFSITITGNKEELANGLAVLKAVMGDQIQDGSVTAAVAPPTQQPQAPVQPPAQQAPAQAPQQTAMFAPPFPTQPAQGQAPAIPTAPVAPPAQQQAPATAQAPAVPTSTQSYSQEQLAVAATQLMDQGKQGELINLLQSFGVQALTALPKERYGEFATALRQMGAKI